ncbi:MAG: TIGR02449 family protein [Cellvibrionaceae bacterium]
MSQQQITELESQVNQLIVHCERMMGENASLKDREQQLLKERAKLVEKNELAKTRVEAMILRLKSLEQDA